MFWIIRRTFLKKENYSLTQAREIFIKKRIDVIPVIGGMGKVVDVITFEDFFKNKKNNNNNTHNFPKTVVIMAGGKGTRLRPYNNNRPKPMLKISGKPILEMIINSAKKQGFENFIFSIN